MRSHASFTLSAILSLLALTSASGQLTHPEDPTASLVAIDTVWSFLQPSGSPPLLKADGHGATRHIIHVWRTTSGRIDYRIDVASFEAGDSGYTVDGLATIALFDQLAAVSVMAGADRGRDSVSADTLAPTRSRVYASACIDRGGSGIGTTLTPCGSDYGYRIVTIAEPQSGVYHTSVETMPATTECSQTSCEPTITPSDNAGLQRSTRRRTPRRALFAAKVARHG